MSSAASRPKNVLAPKLPTSVKPNPWLFEEKDPDLAQAADDKWGWEELSFVRVTGDTNTKETNLLLWWPPTPLS